MITAWHLPFGGPFLNRLYVYYTIFSANSISILKLEGK